jgi:hypothetical protein
MKKNELNVENKITFTIIKKGLLQQKKWGMITKEQYKYLIMWNKLHLICNGNGDIK